VSAREGVAKGQELTIGGQGGNSTLEMIRQKGQVAVANQQALREMYVMLEGVEWGSGNSVVRGSSFSPAARSAFAKFCVVTRANPQIHVDLLGGKPYLNAQYYRDKLSSDPHFIDDDLVNLSPRLSTQLREQAEQALAEARKLGLPEPTSEVQELLAQARMIERLRAEWGVPDWATDVYESRIRRYTENAPIDEIRRGTIQDPERFIRLVRECNWAGNRPPKPKSGGGTYDADPIGNMEPAKTARTRAFRRAARNAFSAWFDQFDDEITRAEEIVNAEWEVVQEDRAAVRAALPAEAGPQAVRTGGGEPAAASPADAQPLPVTDATGDPRPATSAAQQPFDRAAARRDFFGALHDAGIPEKDRKAWAVGIGLPESTKEWTAEQFATAMAKLIPLVRTQLLEAVGAIGYETIEEYAAAKELPSETARDLHTLLNRVRDDTGQDPQGRLV
jgi:hypothetical protein